MNHTGVVRDDSACRAALPPQARPRPASSGTSHLGGGDRAVAPTEAGLAGERRVDEADRAAAPRARRRRRAGSVGPTRVGAEPALVEQLLAREHPGVGRRASCLGGREQLGGGARRARAGSGSGRRPRRSSTMRVERREREPAVRADVHLTVVGGDQQRGVVGQRVEQRRRRAGRRPRARPGRTAPSSPYACATSSTPG